MPGQHADVRLTAEDGYCAQRSYSIASAPEAGRLEFTVQHLDDGEVSPCLAGIAEPGDQSDPRGPIAPPPPPPPPDEADNSKKCSRLENYA